MPVTLLAVDDSVTMRKVFEMTFEGDSFRVLTAESADAALALLRREKPEVVLADITLPGKTGYDLCAAIKRDNPGLPVLLMASKLNPYDKARGQAAKADDSMDKPFDTQKLVDRVNGLLSGAKSAQPPSAPKLAIPARAPAQLGATLIGQGPSFRPQLKPSTTATGQAASQLPNLRSTTEFSTQPAVGPSIRNLPTSGTPAASAASAPTPLKPAPARLAVPTQIQSMQVPSPAPSAVPVAVRLSAPIAPPIAAQIASPNATPIAPPVAIPAAAPIPASIAAQIAPPAAAPVAAQIAAASVAPVVEKVPAQAVASAALVVDSSLNKSLETLGLTKDQIAGVLALSHEIVERVVWEVVPVLAETIIKEEIKRLTEEK